MITNITFDKDPIIRERQYRYMNKQAFFKRKTNAPTFAYQTVYGKNPNQSLSGRTSAPKKMWKGLDVDKGLKNKWLNKLNDLPVEIRSTDEGKDSIRPAFTIIRMPKDKDDLHKKMVKYLKKQPDLHVKSDIGMGGRPRICVAGKIWKGKKDWGNWWETLPDKINSAYNKTVKGNGMNKQAFLEETYNSAFNDELEKVALSGKTLASYSRKRAVSANKLFSKIKSKSGDHLTRSERAWLLNIDRKGINKAISKLKVLKSNKPIKEEARRQASGWSWKKKDLS